MRSNRRQGVLIAVVGVLGVASGAAISSAVDSGLPRISSQSYERPPTESTTTTTIAAPSTTTTSTSTGLVWGYDATPPSASRQRLGFYEASTDPIYQTQVRRVASAEGTRFNRNDYSRRQAENSDGTAFLTYHGSATYHVYQRSDGALLRQLDMAPGAYPYWHPTDPDRLRHVADKNSYGGTLELLETSVSSGQTTVLADLTSRIQASFPTAKYMNDRAEGSPSRDGSRYAFIVFDGDEQRVGIVSYDLSTDTVLGTAPLETGVGELDWVSASPTGNYVVAGYWDAAYVYDLDMSNRRLLVAAGEHSDIALGADGVDTYVYIDFTAGPNGGWLVAVNMATLQATRIFDVYDDANTSIHISGKGYDKPGWVVISTYNCKDPGAWSCEKVMAVELAPQGRVLNLAHTYNCGDNYWTETHAVVNESFTRIYFNSDSGSCGMDAEVHELQVPAFN